MKSVLVIGMGRFGRHLATKMQELGNDVMVIDKDPEKIECISEMFTDSQIGDCSNEAVLSSIGVRNFDICFVAIGEDFQASLEITLTLKKLGASFVVAKAKRDRQAAILEKIGADEVVYPEREIAEKIAIRYNSKNVFDFIELTSEYAIYEIPIIKTWVQRSIREINIRQKHSVNIIAIKKDSKLIPMPSPDYLFDENDHIVVIGASENVFKIVAKT